MTTPTEAKILGTVDNAIGNAGPTTIKPPEPVKREMSLSDQIRAGTSTEKEIVARFAEVLDRGITNDRLTVPLPPDVHGEWCPNDAQSIHRLQLLGFEVDDKFAINRSLHSDATGKPIVSDVIFMTQSMRLHQLYEGEKMRRYEERHGTKRVNKNQAEERTGLDLPITNTSSTESVSGQQIATSIKTEA